MFLFDAVILAVGFAALIKGADLFVDGSSALARYFKVPGVIIGLTIVALGTSAPELAVSTSAALQGSNEIALSNVVGSNIFNLLCVLGICAIIHPVPVDSAFLRRDFPISIAATFFILIATGLSTILSGRLFRLEMEAMAGYVSRATSIVILLAFLSYMVYLIHDARKHPEGTEAGEHLPLWKCFALIALGLALVIAGGQGVVFGAKEIARTLGMSETLIGLTVVAIGTSLPELATSMIAAKKGETGLAVGNVIGSNIFNLLFILGISAAIHPIGVNAASIYDLIILASVSILCLIFSFTRKAITRLEGIIMICLYIGCVIFAAIR